MALPPIASGYHTLQKQWNTVQHNGVVSGKVHVSVVLHHNQALQTKFWNTSKSAYVHVHLFARSQITFIYYKFVSVVIVL